MHPGQFIRMVTIEPLGPSITDAEEAEVVVTLRKRLASLRKGVRARSFEDAVEDLGKKYASARKR